MKHTYLCLIVLIAMLGIAAAPAGGGFDAQKFKEYWYKGKAELDRYSLTQARYGQTHEGEAVLIFVTEPFLKDKQVKYEHGVSKERLNVLKLNFTKRFFTGIYPYTLI